MEVITAAQLTRFLRYPEGEPVGNSDAELAEQVALGWLSDPTGITNWENQPANPGTALFSWVLELAGLAYENPTSQEQDQSGDVTSAWSPTARDRRSQILASARAWAQRNGSSPSTGAPRARGNFPAAEGWPDPARRRW